MPARHTLYLVIEVKLPIIRKYIIYVILRILYKLPLLVDCAVRLKHCPVILNWSCVIILSHKKHASKELTFSQQRRRPIRKPLSKSNQNPSNKSRSTSAHLSNTADLNIPHSIYIFRIDYVNF